MRLRAKTHKVKVLLPVLVKPYILICPTEKPPPPPPEPLVVVEKPQPKENGESEELEGDSGLIHSWPPKSSVFGPTAAKG